MMRMDVERKGAAVVVVGVVGFSLGTIEGPEGAGTR